MTAGAVIGDAVTASANKKLDMFGLVWYVVCMRLLKNVNHERLLQAAVVAASLLAGWLTVALQHL